MKRIWIRKIANRITVTLFCFTLFLYTMAFPGNTSWFILLFFSLLLLVAFLTTLLSFGKAEVNLRNQLDYKKEFILQTRTRFYLPILIPEITARVTLKDMQLEEKLFPLFRNQLTIHLHNLQLPRGRYSLVRLETWGRDYFGFFTHYSSKKIPVAFDIYPEPFAPKDRHTYVNKILGNPYLKRYIKSNAAEFRQIREYIPQDAMKHVDWKSSSRKNKLMVKEYEKEIQPTITLLFMGGTSPSFEVLLRLTYSLFVGLRDQFQVRFVLIGSFEGTFGQQDVLEAFLTIEPTRDEEKLLHAWQHTKVAGGFTIGIAESSLIERMKQARTEPIISFSELDIIQREVSNP